MKAFAFLLLLALPASAANITYSLNLSLEAECPGDMLYIDATSSAGAPASDVELRLVLYSPYQGLRALMHTDEQGQASVELTRAGQYRIYINTEDYNHPRYVTFNYSSLCPLPPPKGLNISIEHSCGSGLMKVTAKEEDIPQKDVFITNGNWSTLSDSGGEAVLPFFEGGMWVQANKSGFTSISAYTNISCAPPECLGHSDCDPDQYCWSGDCYPISGACGFAENHTWFVYECCADSDCGSGEGCEDNFCEPYQNASNTTIGTNITNVTSNNSSEVAPLEDGVGIIFLALMLPNFFKTGNR